MLRCPVCNKIIHRDDLKCRTCGAVLNTQTMSEEIFLDGEADDTSFIESDGQIFDKDDNHLPADEVKVSEKMTHRKFGSVLRCHVCNKIIDKNSTKCRTCGTKIDVEDIGEDILFEDE